MSTDQPPIDPSVDLIELQEVEGEKFCTNCGKRKPLEEGFHKDSTKGDGYRDTCKECRSKLAEQDKKSRMHQKLKELEDESLETLDSLRSGGSFDPHINELFEAMMRPFGGVHGWAKHLFATYLACEPGSQKRIKVHEMMVNVASKVTQLGLAERQLDMIEEKELMHMMKACLREYQDHNNLPSNAIPTLDGKVVDAEKGERIDG